MGTRLKVRAAWDDAVYEKGINVTDRDLAALQTGPANWHGERNYSVRPVENRTTPP
jgi:hypothetical protein